MVAVHTVLVVHHKLKVELHMLKALHTPKVLHRLRALLMAKPVFQQEVLLQMATVQMELPEEKQHLVKAVNLVSQVMVAYQSELVDFEVMLLAAVEGWSSLKAPNIAYFHSLSMSLRCHHFARL